MTITSATNMNDPDLNKTYVDMLKLQMKNAKGLCIKNDAEYVVVITCKLVRKNK